MRLMVIEPKWTQRVWVMSEVGSGRCAAFEQSYIVYEQDCSRRYHPFICETGEFHICNIFAVYLVCSFYYCHGCLGSF